MREALDALEDMEKQLVPASERSMLSEVVEGTMLSLPDNWLPYYHGSPEQQNLLRQIQLQRSDPIPLDKAAGARCRRASDRKYDRAPDSRDDAQPLSSRSI
jgi:hypothetical protein